MLDAWVLICEFRVYSFTRFGFHEKDIVFGNSDFMFQVTDFYILIRSCRFPFLRFAIHFCVPHFCVYSFALCVSLNQFRRTGSLVQISGFTYLITIADFVNVWGTRLHDSLFLVSNF